MERMARGRLLEHIQLFGTGRHSDFSAMVAENGSGETEKRNVSHDVG